MTNGGESVQLRWIRTHVRIRGSERADRLAKEEGAEASMEGKGERSQSHGDGKGTGELFRETIRAPP